MKQSEARFMAVKCALSSVEALYFTAPIESCAYSGRFKSRPRRTRTCHTRLKRAVLYRMS